MKNCNSSIIAFVAIVVCCMFPFRDFSRIINVDVDKPEVISTEVKLPKLTWTERAKLSQFHQDLAKVLTADPSLFDSLADFQFIYENSRRICLPDISASEKSKQISLYICSVINKEFNVSKQRQLSSKLSDEEKAKLVAVLVTISKKLGSVK